MLGLALLAGCAHHRARPVASPPANFAPTTGWVASRETPIDAAQVLAGPEIELYATRAEKVAYGPLPLGSVTAYSTYTYDAQRISTFSGYGYRYRWVVENGISAPVAP
jgi:hypothetical protein